MSGVLKAVWLLFLVFLPFLTALAYLVFRGEGMARRTVRQQAATREAVDEHIRTVAGGPASEIAQAKALLDSGAVTPEEYDALKRAVLARTPN